MHMIAVIFALCFALQATAQPLPPTELTIRADSMRHVTLRWWHPGADSFHVRSSNLIEEPFAPLATVVETHLVDTVMASSRFYEVTAYFDNEESVPCSNQVGYVKITCVANGFTPFGLPFRTWDAPSGIPSYGIPSTDPSDVFGEQTRCGAIPPLADLIWRQDTGELAYRNCSNFWRGTLQESHGMTPGRAFWFRNRSGTNRTLILAGEADTISMSGCVTFPAHWFMAYSWRDPRFIPREQLFSDSGCFQCGPVQGASSYVIEQSGASNLFWCRSGGDWQGMLLGIDPGEAYWIFNRGEECTYCYDPFDPDE